MWKRFGGEGDCFGVATKDLSLKSKVLSIRFMVIDKGGCCGCGCRDPQPL
jgi:hypothetical protein